MTISERLGRLDERVLGLAGIAFVCAWITATLLIQAGQAASDDAWLRAVVLTGLAVIPGQAAVRTWQLRRRRRGAPVEAQ